MDEEKQEARRLNRQRNQGDQYIQRCSLLAMQGILASGDRMTPEKLAKDAYKIARAMLAEKNKRDGNA